MTTHRRPAVFVSSACYDLAQVRQDLRDAIHCLGMEPILSEINSFPVDPNVGTVENCLAGVRSSADLFLKMRSGVAEAVETGEATGQAQEIQFNIAPTFPDMTAAMDELQQLLLTV